MIISPMLFLLVVAILIFMFFIKKQELKPYQFTKPKYLVVSSGLVAIAYIIFAYASEAGLGLNVFYALSLLAIYLVYPTAKQTWSFYALMLLGGLVTGLSLFRANDFLLELDQVIFLAVAAVLLFYYIVDKFKWQGVWFIKTAFLGLGYWARHVLSLFSKQSPAKFPGLNLRRLIVTGGLTGLVLFVFGNLFIQADPIFEQTIAGISQDLSLRLASGFALFLFAMSVLTLSLKLPDDDSKIIKGLSFYEVFVPLLSLVGLFAVFITIQMQYLFAGEQVVTQFGLTYSDYVRQGFMELLVATVMGAILVYLATFKQRMLEDSKEIMLLKSVNSLLIIGLAVLILSALKRNWLYIDIYGLTRIRVFGELFLYGLGFGLLALGAFVLWPKFSEKYLWASSFLVVMVLIGAMHVVNYDGKIAVHAATNDLQPDYYYINNLSADAINGWLASIAYNESELNQLQQINNWDEDTTNRLVDIKLSLIALENNIEKLYLKYGPFEDLDKKYFDSNGRLRLKSKLKRRFVTFNWSEYQAFKALNRDKHIRDQVNDLQELVEQIEQQQPLNLYQATKRRQHEFEYPLMQMVELKK